MLPCLFLAMLNWSALFWALLFFRPCFTMSSTSSVVRVRTYAVTTSHRLAVPCNTIRASAHRSVRLGQGHRTSRGFPCVRLCKLMLAACISNVHLLASRLACRQAAVPLTSLGQRPPGCDDGLSGAAAAAIMQTSILVCFFAGGFQLYVYLEATPCLTCHHTVAGLLPRLRCPPTRSRQTLCDSALERLTLHKGCRVRKEIC